MDLNNLASLKYFYPESLLTVGVLIVVLLDLVIRNKSFLGDLALVVTAASLLLMAYLSLEFVSLTSYVLTGFLKHNRRSQEAALKYLIYGGVASGTMIYGMSWIYGIAGSLDFSVINRALTTAGHVPVLTVFIALMLIISGMGYKIAAVPFHMWAPDVYERAPIPLTTFL